MLELGVKCYVYLGVVLTELRRFYYAAVVYASTDITESTMVNRDSQDQLHFSSKSSDGRVQLAEGRSLSGILCAGPFLKA